MAPVTARLVWLLALVGVAAGLAGSSPGGTGAGPRLADQHPCFGTRGYTCSTLTVPLDPRGRVPGELRLQVGAANNVSAPRGVLLLLTGGPGQPGVPFLSRLDAVAGALARQYRMVVYDQRGTGAGAIRCPALQAAMGSSDLWPPPASAVRACAAELGERRSLYGTDDVVADMERLRQALGVERWTIDGISYGTYVAERYALAYPDRVDRLVLDSLVPHDLRPIDLLTPLRAPARVLRLACRASGCAGDPAADLATVVQKHHRGPKLLDALTLLSIVDPTFRTLFDVPALLHRAARGDVAGIDRLVRTVHGWEETPAERLSQGLHAAALCGDWRLPWGWSSAPLAGRAAALTRWAVSLRASTTWPFDRATAVGNGFVQQCLPWPPTEPTPPVSPGARLRVPTLMVSGDRDLSTPLEWARQEAALAPGSRLVVVRGAGHSVQSRARNEAGRQAVAAFLLG
jgi:pimeloyl-ACP methyl ester carboxylesterase